ncbi:hypothetical protein ACOSQ2_012079 [Xanthoceras sorbifolium]
MMIITSAQLSTSWTNNNFSAVNITKSSENSQLIMRIILLNVPSGSGGGFACGFLSSLSTGNSFLAAASVRIRKDFLTEYVCRSDVEVIWLANRNKPIHENATLELHTKGDLILRDIDGTLVWSTNTSHMSVVGLQMLKNGNLKLMAGQELVARASSTDWNEGSYYLSVTSAAEPSEPDVVLSRPIDNLEIGYMRFDSDGFARQLVSDDQSDFHCREINPPTCENRNAPSLLQLQDVHYFNYVDRDAADLKGIPMESCKQACLRNCTSKLLNFSYFNITCGNCFLPSQGRKIFLLEVKTIGSIHHVNLVRLIGFCAENLHRLLVYEFMCNGSKTIIIDMAKGIAYLHEDCRQRIVHVDIKPQNILLDRNLSAKISDFGLSKLIDKDHSQVVTTMRGTPGYLAPELFRSIVTEKVDVYSFRIVVMEVVCGRKNLDQLQSEECMHLLLFFMKNVEVERLIDSSEVMQMRRVAVWCLHNDFTRRPSLSMVVKILEGTMNFEASLAEITREAE